MKMMNTASPKDLILNILSASEGRPLQTREAVDACALFGLRASSVRVALARLCGAGVIEAIGRGAYQLGPTTAGLVRELGSWRSMEQRLKEWSGAWVMVCSGMLGRVDRPALSRRQRALSLLGFKELDRDIYVRPDNLVGGVEAIRERLRRLGLEQEAFVLLAFDLGTERDAQARALWDGQALNTSYRQTRERLEHSLVKMSELEPEEAARESFLLGEAAIRQMIYDPLLPAPLIDEAERRACLAVVRQYDLVGHNIWLQISGTRLGQNKPGFSVALN